MILPKVLLLVSCLGVTQSWMYKCSYPFKGCNNVNSSSNSSGNANSDEENGNSVSNATSEVKETTEANQETTSRNSVSNATSEVKETTEENQETTSNVQTESFTITTTKAVETIENVAEASNTLDNLKTSNLSSSEKNDVISGILDSVEELFASNSAERNENSFQTWTTMFDKMTEHVDALEANVIEEFLETSTNILIEIVTETDDQEVNSKQVRDVALKIEDYAVTTTKYLLDSQQDTEEPVALHLDTTDIFACRSDSDKCLVKSTSFEIENVDLSTNDMPYLTYVVHKSLQEKKNTSSVGSQIVAATAHDGNGGKGSATIQFMLKHIEGFDSTLTQCGFIDEKNDSEWSTHGCHVVSSNTSHTRCHCNHMTNFAILFLHSDIQISEEENLWFNIITYVGCGISITALLVTMATFFALKLHRSERVILLWHLCFCLCAAQIVLVAGTNAVVGTIECKVIAILMHFFFMASFSWMLMEGCQLYFKAVRAVKGGYNFKVVLVTGWLIPVIIVSITIGAGLDGYGTGRGCWISLDNGLVWAFIGPAIGCIAVNCVLLIFVMKVFLGLKSVLKTNEAEKTKRAAKALACLMPLLGITWVFGLFAVGESTKWFLYVFCVCNSLQGMGIFILHCARNDEVKKAFLKKYRRSFMSIGAYSISSSSRSQKSGETYLSKPTSEFPSSLPKIAKW